MRLLVIVVLLAACGPVPKRQPPAPKAAAPHMRVDANLGRLLDSAVQPILAERFIPGASVAVLRHDTLMYAAGHGIADLETRQPVTPETVFQIASLTKPFTAMTVLMLAEIGCINLDATASSYLGWLPAKYSAITVRQLLTHTSGVSPDMRRANVDEMDVAEFRRRLEERGINFPPGTSIQYANAGYTLLSWIVERVSGEEFGAFLSRQIFLPLGMTSSGYRVPWQNHGQHAVGYELVDGSLTEAPHVFSGWGNSGIETNILDLARWATALERRELLSSESFASMYTPARLASGETVSFNQGAFRMGLSWFITSYKGAEQISHGGAVAGFSSIYNRFPHEGWTILVLSNGKQGTDRLGQADAIARAIANALGIGASGKPQPRE